MVIERVGVIGGGQLAWMMAGAAEKLGVKLIIQTPHESDPAVAITADTILAPIDDAQATAQLASRCDVITFENEFVNLDALTPLAEQGVCFRPRLQVLTPILDKYDQRCFIRDLGLPVPKFFALEEKLTASAASQLHSLDFPVVMKARRHGYDGQGTAIIKTQSELEATWEQWKYVPVMLEEFVPFERELAVIAARSVSGEIAIYPIVETQQENQVCRRVIVPANLEPQVIIEIEAIARTLLEGLQVVGIFGIELFLTANQQVLINEIAPRTHNSGHFSLDACETSQFEQHLRAVCGFSLGNPNLSCAGAVMVNLLGFERSQNPYLDKRQKLAEIPHAHVHWYGKTESRPGRKLGHVTILLNSPSAQLREESLKLAQICDSIWYG